MSRKIDRRTVIAGIAGALPAAAVGAVPALAEPDPAFAAVARARATYDAVCVAYQTASDADIPEADAHDEAYEEFMSTAPWRGEGVVGVGRGRPRVDAAGQGWS